MTAPIMKIMLRTFLMGKNWSLSLSGRLCLLCEYCVSMNLLLMLLLFFSVDVACSKKMSLIASVAA